MSIVVKITPNDRGNSTVDDAPWQRDVEFTR
jgi:hypothetical protein